MTSRSMLRLILLGALCAPFSVCSAEVPMAASQFRLSQYAVWIEPGDPPQISLSRHGETVFRMPLVSGLATTTAQERLSSVTYSVRKMNDGVLQLDASATSSLWKRRTFRWRFFEDHLEFQQFANGSGKLGRCFFLSNGVSNRWNNGTSAGIAANTTIYADHYFAPNPNLGDQTEFTIAMPQTLGFSPPGRDGSDEDFRPERMTGIFAPPPLMLSFHLGGEWISMGLGTRPGDYQFPAFEYSGSRYAGASFYVDYLGYKEVDGGFASPVLAIHFAFSALGTLDRYTSWLKANGFATAPVDMNVRWHRLPIFCGWGEQNVESVPQGRSANQLSTQQNYEKWVAELEKRKLPVGTIVIDDKWQERYGTFEVDTQKWPDLKAFVANQHAKGRHVLLWLPVADPEGLPAPLCITLQGRCVLGDVGNPEYEAFLRKRIRHLIQDIGVDGFKEDWVNDPAAPGLLMSGHIAGIEFVRKFQAILYSETHALKPDAMVETQTPNALFLDSSDVIRLNDIWYGSRNVADMMRLRANIAHITGWPAVDTDDASSTNLREWWAYLQAQPSIGIPSLYIVTRTQTTFETPTQEDWTYLASIWDWYIGNLSAAKPELPAP